MEDKTIFHIEHLLTSGCAVSHSPFSCQSEILRWNRAGSQSRSMSRRANRRQAEEIKRGPTKKRAGY